MMAPRKLRLEGVIPANLMPFKPDLEIDEPELRRHLEWLTSVPGVTAITTNGHAAEVASLTRSERQRSLDITVDQVRGRVKVIAGVYSDNTAEAVQLARDAKEGGADAVLVFPPATFSIGAHLRPEMAFAHFASIADAVDIPIVIFQYPVSGGLSYSLETLVRLADEIDNVVAIKDWTSDSVRHEENVRALHSLRSPISVLTTHSAWLLPSLVLGCDGLLSGTGSVIADLQAALFQAVQRGDLPAAQSIYSRFFVLTQVFYAAPLVDMHNRMKEALVMLGRLERAVVRPPLLPISAVERERIRKALVAAEMLKVETRC